MRRRPDLVEGPYRDVVRRSTRRSSARCSGRRRTCRRSRRGVRRSTSAPMFTRSARCSITCSRATPPYDGATTEEVLGNVISAPPPPLATRAPDAPADLVAIVDKAMARKPDDRYPNAGELADRAEAVPDRPARRGTSLHGVRAAAALDAQTSNRRDRRRARGGHARHGWRGELRPDRARASRGR